MRPVRTSRTNTTSHPNGFTIDAPCRLRGPNLICYVSPSLRNRAQAEEREIAARFLRVLPNDRYGLRRSDVVARLPVDIGHDIKVLLENLLPSREPVASAHVLIIAETEVPLRPYVGSKSS